MAENGSAVAAGDAALAGSFCAAAGDLPCFPAPPLVDGLIGKGLDTTSADAESPGDASTEGIGADIDGCTTDGETTARTSFKGAGACGLHSVSHEYLAA